MKALGGGHLSNRSNEALAWILEEPNIAAVAVGMQTNHEVLFNVSAFNQQSIDNKLQEIVQNRHRKLLVEDGCMGCGNCVAKCPMQALYFTSGQVAVDRDKCILCGYCGAYCSEFALKII